MRRRREKKPRRRIAPKSIERVKNRIRELTLRKRGDKLELIVDTAARVWGKRDGFHRMEDRPVKQRFNHLDHGLPPLFHLFHIFA